jgi:hypothetical protein
MKKTALVCSLIVAGYAPIAGAGFWGHIAEHATGYAAGAQ